MIARVLSGQGKFKRGDIVVVEHRPDNRPRSLGILIRTTPVPGIFDETEDSWWLDEIRLATETEILAGRLLGEI